MKKGHAEDLVNLFQAFIDLTTTADLLKLAGTTRLQLS